jgi:hypothetical protein
VAADVLNQPGDVAFVLTQVHALDHTAGDELSGRIDTGHVAAAGHSAGAITTIGLLDNCCADSPGSAGSPTTAWPAEREREPLDAVPLHCLACRNVTPLSLVRIIRRSL